MRLLSFRALMSRILPASRVRRSLSRHRLRLLLEVLEDRTVPTTFTANNTLDSGLVSVPHSSLGGLVINRFRHAGIELSGDGATNDIVAGNFIGTNTLGTTALSNGQGGGTGGVLLINGANNDIVGGETAAARKVISG